MGGSQDIAIVNKWAATKLLLVEVEEPSHPRPLVHIGFRTTNNPSNCLLSTAAFWVKLHARLSCGVVVVMGREKERENIYMCHRKRKSSCIRRRRSWALWKSWIHCSKYRKKWWMRGGGMAAGKVKISKKKKGLFRENWMKIKKRRNIRNWDKKKEYILVALQEMKEKLWNVNYGNKNIEKMLLSSLEMKKKQKNGSWLGS